MPTAREIRDRISSIDQTLKITNAMYLISSTKILKARRELRNTEPYFFDLQQMISRVLRHMPEDFTHPYLDQRESVRAEDRTRAIICVTADKGLAGAYNHNVLRQTEQMLDERVGSQLYVVGEIGRAYFEGRHQTIDEQFHYTAQNPSLHRARTIAGAMMEKFFNREIDELYIVYTTMKNSVEMQVEAEQLLPLTKLDMSLFRKYDLSGVPQEEFWMEPSASAVLDNIIPSYLTGFIYSALVESFCAEQSARMTAMDNANKSGEELRAQLRIQYNRVRQAQITQEITEVAAGANAQRAAQRRKKRKEASHSANR